MGKRMILNRFSSPKFNLAMPAEKLRFMV